LARHPQILARNKTALLIVDVQKRINAVQMQGELVVSSIATLIRACKVLEIPIFLTEQYPKGLGPTEPAILELLEDIPVIQKMTFSCCGIDALTEQLETANRRQIVVVGIEAHVCVQQTVLDLMAMGFQVHIPKDAVSSRKALDYETALERMAQAGAILSTVETVVFELLEKAGTDVFKSVSRLIK